MKIILALSSALALCSCQSTAPSGSSCCQTGGACCHTGATACKTAPAMTGTCKTCGKPMAQCVCKKH